MTGEHPEDDGDDREEHEGGQHGEQMQVRQLQIGHGVQFCSNALRYRAASGMTMTESSRLPHSPQAPT